MTPAVACQRGSNNTAIQGVQPATTRRKYLSWILPIAAAIILAPSQASAQTASGTRVVPGSWTNNSGTNSPLAGTPSSYRYQLLTGRKPELGTGTIIINQIAFRAYPGTGPLNFTIANLTVYLSTSPFYPNTENFKTLMSTTFANNIGSDNTLVFSGPKNVSSPGCAGPSPCPFDVVIPLSTPFVYNPGGGLLVDIQATGFNATSGSFDDALFAYPPGGGVASVSGTLGSATGIFAPSGHVMQIGYTGCSYGLNSPGQTFTSAGGTANVTVNTPAGCSWSISGVPNWVTPSALSGSGTTALSFQVGANAGADQSTSFTIAGLFFNIQQQAASIPGLNLIGSMAHLAAEENWTTTFTLVNKSGSAAATARLNLFGDPADPTGNGPLTLTVAFPQQPVVSGRIDAAFLDSAIAPNASWLATTQVQPASTSLVGSAQLAATGPVDGFAIFHQIPTAQEAVVPLETRNASSYLLAYDNTGGIVLGIAVANISAQAANVNVVLRDDTGAQIGSPLPITLSSNEHKSFVLSSQFPATANKRGTIEFDTPPGGQISVLGIRFTPPNNALTTIPALANVGTGGGSIAHLAAGGDGWQTTFVLVNTGISATSATLSFFNDQTGFPLSLPLSFPQGGTAITVPAYTAQLAAGASIVIVSSGTPQLLATGSAQLTSTGNVSGFVIFRHGGQEAVVPLESRNANGYIIAFDNTSGTFTGIALNSVSALPANVPVIIRDDTGAQIGTDTLVLAANGHLAFTLVTDKYPQTADLRGTIEFDKPAGATIGALGIRIPPGALTTYTTLPALDK
jgi:hypothetical protein